MQNNNHKLVYALMALLLAEPAMAASGHPARPHRTTAKKAATIRALRSCTSVTVDKPSQVTPGKPSVILLSAPATRVFVGDKTNVGSMGKLDPGSKTPLPALPALAAKSGDGIDNAELTLLSPTKLFFRGNKAGTLYIILQSASGDCHIREIAVTIAPAVKKQLEDLLGEHDIQVEDAGNSLVLSGPVSDTVKLDQAMTIATAYAHDQKVINLLRVRAPQEVMLEVKIAEVSKTLLDKLNIDFARLLTAPGGGTSRIISGIIGGGPATFGQFHNNIGAIVSGMGGGAVGAPPGAAVGTLTASGSGATLLGVNAQKQDGLVRILAEPNLTAISGQSASFLSGGKIFIPVSQTNTSGAPTITLEEKKFGVGLTFTPIVLQDGHINLKLTTEASELAQTGSPFTSVGGVTAILPSLTTRQADTTVELKDGQSFAIAGLIRNNITESIHRFPGLGDMPVLGALFRSTEFQKDQTELIFVVTPHLVKPTTARSSCLPIYTGHPALPTPCWTARRKVLPRCRPATVSPPQRHPARRLLPRQPLPASPINALERPMKKHALPFLFALLAGCAVSPQYDAHFGDAVREARLQMTLHPRPLPDANDASTMTGPAARAAMQQYQDSFKTPPPVVNVINISGVAGHSGSQ